MSSQAPDIGHTPGPWFWNDRDQLVGELWEDWIGEGDPEDMQRAVIVETDSGHYAPYGADRLLIAAAPDLLETLRLVLDESRHPDYSRGDWSDQVVMRRVEAVIAKATGGTTT